LENNGEAMVKSYQKTVLELQQLIERGELPPNEQEKRPKY